MAIQLLAGQNRVVYWGMSYLWDFISITIPIAIIVVIFVIFNEQAYIGRDHVGGFIVLMLVYGLAITPLMYCFTFAFHVPSVAFVTLLAINIIVATVTAVIYHMLDLISYENPDVESAVQVLGKVFLIFPQFAFCRGFYDLAKSYTVNQQGLDRFIETYGIFDWRALTEKLVALLIEAVIFSGLVLIISYNSGSSTCEKCRRGRRKRVEVAVADELDGDSKPAISEDVMEEIERVENVSAFICSQLSCSCVDLICVTSWRREVEIQCHHKRKVFQLAKGVTSEHMTPRFMSGADRKTARTSSS